MAEAMQPDLNGSLGDAQSLSAGFLREILVVSQVQQVPVLSGQFGQRALDVDPRGSRFQIRGPGALELGYGHMVDERLTVSAELSQGLVPRDRHHPGDRIGRVRAARTVSPGAQESLLGDLLGVRVGSEVATGLTQASARGGIPIP